MKVYVASFMPTEMPAVDILTYDTTRVYYRKEDAIGWLKDQAETLEKEYRKTSDGGKDDVYTLEAEPNMEYYKILVCESRDEEIVFDLTECEIRA